MTTPATTVEAVQQTLAEYERLAIGTDQWNGSEIEFANYPDEGLPAPEWSLFPRLTDEHPHPDLARATVHREGVMVPTVVVVPWVEALPADDEWRALWLRKPSALFGAFALRAALRRAFRDVIGDRHEPDERDAQAAAPAEPVHRDWLVELSDMETEDEVQQFHRDAKAARAVSVELERAIRQRLVAVRAGLTADHEVKPPMAKPTPGLRVARGSIIGLPAVEHIVPLGKPHSVTPADLAAALAKIGPAVAPQKPRSKNSRPQKQKPRGPRG